MSRLRSWFRRTPRCNDCGARMTLTKYGTRYHCEKSHWLLPAKPKAPDDEVRIGVLVLIGMVVLIAALLLVLWFGAQR